MTTDERIERLITVADRSQAQIVAHNARIENLIPIAEIRARKNEDRDRLLKSLLDSTADLEKQ